MNFQQEIDARHEHCPKPVMKTKKALKLMNSGEVLHVMATDPDAVQDIKILLEVLCDEMLESNESNGEYHFYIRKG